MDAGKSQFQTIKGGFINIAKIVFVTWPLKMKPWIGENKRCGDDRSRFHYIYVFSQFRKFKCKRYIRIVEMHLKLDYLFGGQNKMYLKYWNK